MKLTFIASALLAATFTTYAANTELVVGDQKGNARAVMSAAGELTNVPYEIKWYEFPNAAPLLESLNSQHLDAGLVGDGPLAFAVAAPSHPPIPSPIPPRDSWPTSITSAVGAPRGMW